MANAFVNAVTRGAGSARTENGAASYASLGTNLLDQFGKAGTNRGRDINAVFADQASLFREDRKNSIRFPFYLRMITRQVELKNGEKTETVQKGQGAKDEAFKRLLWFAKYEPDLFYANLWLLPVVGCWKDLWVLLSMDNTLDKEAFFKLFAEGIQNPSTRELVRKYMPRIRSNKKCTTGWATSTNELAKQFAKFVGWSYKDYRNFKSEGTAHKFQTYMCQGLYGQIDWNTIPGKALLNLVSGKFLANHNLSDSYLKWLEKQPVAKFNGYVYEFAQKLRGYYGLASIPKTTKMTIDKQFDNLIQTAKKDKGGIQGNVWVALDTSGSMNTSVAGTDLRAVELAKSLAIYFAELNEGAFHNNIISFDNTSHVFQLAEGTFTEKWYGRMPNVGCGGTNFQGVIDEIIRVKRQHPEIPESDFPQTIIAVSDMQFNPAGGWGSSCSTGAAQTNYTACVNKLRAAGFSDEFLKNWKMVWWYCVNRTTNDFPSNMDCPGTYMFSGFDGAIVTLLLGGDGFVDPKTGEKKTPTMQEMVEAALSQEVLELVKA